MKITVKVDDQLFDVEVGDLYARPVVAVVDGTYFEVWPEVGPSPAELGEQPAHATHPVTRLPAMPAPASAESGPQAKAVHAPIPGVIVSIAVKAGDRVTIGQELCVLEAMKMKNIIRAPRAGDIASVVVQTGDHVRHHDVLFEYGDNCP